MQLIPFHKKAIPILVMYQFQALMIMIGRSLDSCVADFNYMLGRPTAPAGVPQPYPFSLQPPRTPQPQVKPLTSELSPGRPPPPGPGQPMQVFPAPLGRSLPPPQLSSAETPIQARPQLPDPSMQRQFAHFAAVNEPMTPFRGPEPTSAGGRERQGKKRGRPSKADQEHRAAEAAARGEPYPPPKRVKAPRTSGGGSASKEGAAGSSASKKGSGRKSTAEAAPAASSVAGALGTVEGVEEPSPTGEGSRAPAEQMELDTPEYRPQTIIPETQDPGSATREPVPSSGRERSGSAVGGPGPSVSAPLPHGTAQSTATVRQESPARSREEAESAVTKA